MYRSNSRRILPIILILLVVAIGIAALVSVGRAIVGGNQASQTQVDIGKQALLDTSGAHSVQMTVRGPIVADEDFRSYQITISPDSRNLTTYSGYLNQPITSIQLDNNTAAYAQFVYALNRANMMNGTQFTGAKDDTRGICATGDVYEFSVLAGSSPVKHLWTSTCSGSPGSFSASITQVENLFTTQIPNDADTIATVNL